MRLARYSWWAAMWSLLFPWVALLAVAGGLISRWRDPASDWEPTVALGTFVLMAYVSAIVLALILVS